MRLTLGNLLDHPEFGLKLLTVGPQARRIPILGAHSIEISHPARWLSEHWVMLTAGVRLRGRPLEQRRLIAELSDAGIASLGFGVGMVSKQVPKALLDEADRRSFPVFSVPVQLPFREIISFVNRSLLSTDLFVLQRVISMQDYLMDAFHEDPPEPVLIRRLASVLRGADVALVEVDGRVTAQTAPSAAAAWSKIRRSSRLHELEHDGRWGVAARVDRANQPSAWLIVLTAEGQGYRQLVSPVTRAAARLLGVPSLARDSGSWRRRRRRRIADVLHDSAAESRRPRFLGALADTGIDFATPCRVVLFAGEPLGAAEPLSSGQLLRRIEELLDRHEVAHVSTERAGRVFTVAQDELQSLGSWLTDISDQHAQIHAGVGEQIFDVEGVQRSLLDARIALADLMMKASPEAVMRYEALDPITLMLASLPNSREHQRLADELAPLADEPRLLETLETYFASDLTVARAASRLGIHHNSLRYRLSRIEQLLGASLACPRTIALLYMALHDRELPCGAAREVAAGGSTLHPAA
ncbi:MAG: PucR family transcriptional regulator ligand-binding domain-containing protein [Acetobacteraceae bacterium]|nr:PucR family transcriptional regulator ligand-binding domain-containing protein [Acetobacteraceae bacterium]